MPTYEYKGRKFTTEHVPSAEEFAQMAAYVDSSPAKQDKAPVLDKLGMKDMLEQAPKAASGAGQALGGMAAGLPAQIAGGLAGLSTLAAGQGLDKAANTSKKVQESNFGFGQFKPWTKEGEEAEHKISSAMEKGIKGAGEMGFKYFGGELGRTNAEIAAEVLMNLVEPGMVVGGVKGAVKRAGQALPKKEAPVADAPLIEKHQANAQVTAANEKLIANLEEAALRKKAENIQTDAKAKQANDVLLQNLQDATLKEKAGRREGDTAAAKQFEELLAADQAAERPNLTSLEGPDGQMSLFDQADQMGQRNQFNGGELGDWRIDENGMPVKVDKSLEALNLEQPLQQGLWGDELGPALDQGRSLTESIDATPANGQWAQRRGMINRLGGRGQELMPGNDLLAAKMEADGPLLPHEDTSMFQPTNPLPTERLGELPPDVPPALTPETPPVAPEGPSSPTHIANVETVAQAAPSQTGASAGLEIADPATRPVPVDSITHPVSPEQIAAKDEKRRAVANMPDALSEKLPEFDGVHTKEEAVALMEKDGWTDIKKDIGQRQFNSGVGMTAALTNHPLLKYTRTIIRDARVQAEAFSRKYISGKEGIAQTWSKMDKDQRMSVVSALIEGDKHQFNLTPEFMAEKGWNEHQIKYATDIRKALDEQWAQYNGNLIAAGFKPLTYREGYFPGIFKGAYKSLVMDGKRTVGVISVDSWWQQQAAKKWFEENHKTFDENGKSTLTIVDQKRKGLAGAYNSSDIFSGVNDVIQTLAKDDPRMAEVQAMVEQAIKRGANNLFDFSKHELAKKGVIGSEGNKPWLSPEKNAETMHRSLVQYMEEGAMHHALQKPLMDLGSLALDPKIQAAVPNALEYVNDYTKKITGRDLSTPGKYLNMAIDAPWRIIGVGPRVPIKIAQEIKNRMSQKFMGFGNYMFMATQLVQPLQTGAPFMQLVAGRLGGLSNVDVPRAMAHGGTQFLLAGLENVTGHKVGILQNHMREAFHYAQNRGMLTFSEMEKAYEGSKSKAGRAFDTVAELNMRIGETGTRTPMFMSFVDIIHQKHPEAPLQHVFEIAENLTQLSMIDYHQFERPMVYSKLGVMGGFAGGLTTFKHGYVGQQILLGKNALGMNAVKKHQVAPMGLSVAAMLATAGITGMIGYDEFDQVFGYLTEKYSSEGRKSIREVALKQLPEWVNSGYISNATNVSVQSKFSSANMLPDTVFKALSPQLEAATKMVDSVWELMKHKDYDAARYVVQQFAPSSLAGAAESAVARDDKDFVLKRDKNLGIYERDLYRKPEDWKTREYTGMRPHSEVLQKEENWAATQKRIADRAKLKEMGQQFVRKNVNQNMTNEERLKAEQEAVKRGAAPGSLIKQFQKAAIEKNMTEKQRLEGIPKDLPSIHRYKTYNPPDINKPGERQ